MIKPGDKVKYIGTGVPKYTGQILEVSAKFQTCVSLFFPEEDRGFTAIENLGVWRSESLLCGFSEVEQINEVEENESL